MFICLVLFLEAQVANLEEELRYIEQTRLEGLENGT